jgi:hypothetical protein
MFELGDSVHVTRDHFRTESFLRRNGRVVAKYETTLNWFTYDVQFLDFRVLRIAEHWLRLGTDRHETTCLSCKRYRVVQECKWCKESACDGCMHLDGDVCYGCLSEANVQNT